MKTLRVTIYIALLFFISIAGKSLAGIDGTLSALNDQCKLQCMSEMNRDSSSCACVDLAFLSVEDVTDSFSGSISSIKTDDLLRSDYSEISLTTAYLLEIPGVITVVQPVVTDRVKVIGQAAGSFGMLLFSVASYFMLVNMRRIYSCLVKAAMVGFDCLTILPALVRNIFLSYVFVKQVFICDNNIETEDRVSGRGSVSISYAGMLKMLASSSVVVLRSLISVIIYCTIDMAQRILLSVCAILFMPVLLLVQVIHRSFWESITIRRCVSRYPVEWPGRVRLAAVCSGLEILGLSKSRPDFNTSFAMSSACFNLQAIPCQKGDVVYSGQEESYLTVYRSRQLPLYNLHDCVKNILHFFEDNLK
ncbi:MAG: hypothetical protein JXM68_12665 [Sedimentisphaerales bacterium]|nr:hypothetical protein [Sedimentisphaerales bacterium]